MELRIGLRNELFFFFFFFFCGFYRRVNSAESLINFDIDKIHKNKIPIMLALTDGQGQTATTNFSVDNLTHSVPSLVLHDQIRPNY